MGSWARGLVFARSTVRVTPVRSSTTSRPSSKKLLPGPFSYLFSRFNTLHTTGYTAFLRWAGFEKEGIFYASSSGIVTTSVDLIRRAKGVSAREAKRLLVYSTLTGCCMTAGLV